MCSFHTLNAQKPAPLCQSLGWQCLGSELWDSSDSLMMEKWAQRKVWRVHTRHCVLGLDAFALVYWPWSLSHVLLFCNPVDCCSPDSSVHRIPQARILEWVAIPFSGGSSQPRDWTWVSCTAGGGFFTVWATREVHNIQGPWCSGS